MHTERYIQLRQEWAHAATLFGRLNGTDWSVLMVVAHYTWGLQRPSAELGMSIFRDRCNVTEESLRKSITRLSTPRTKPGGFGMLRIIQRQNCRTGRVMALEDDWTLWAWDDEAQLERCALAMVAYRRESTSVVSDYVPSDDAVAVATLLRDHCLGLVPDAEVPPIDPGHRQWHRWTVEMDKLLKKHPRQLIERVIVWAHRDTFWTSQIFGEFADMRLSRHFQTLQAKIAAKSTRRS